MQIIAGNEDLMMIMITAVDFRTKWQLMKSADPKAYLELVGRSTEKKFSDRPEIDRRKTVLTCHFEQSGFIIKYKMRTESGVCASEKAKILRGGIISVRFRF